MNNAISFIRLDFITIKPYLTIKNFIIFIVVAFIMINSSGTSASAIGILMMYSTLYVTYPFAVGEKNGIDGLYTTLSIKRNTVVLGRYLFAFTISIFSGIFAYISTYIILTILQKNFNAWESFITTIIMFLVYSTLQAIQLPIFFKLGYTKAKFLAYLPFIGLPLAALLFVNSLKNKIPLEKVTSFFEWFVANPPFAIIFGAIIWFIIMFISYQISLSYYKRRDF